MNDTPSEAPTEKLRAWRVTLEVRAETVMAPSGTDAISKVSDAVRETTDFWDGRIIAVHATEGPERPDQD